MASRYVEVPREMMVEALTKAGFSAVAGTRELTFERAHRLRPDLTIRVFTGFPVDAGEQRGCGEDAIRIVLLYTHPQHGTMGAKKFARVFRTGSPEKVLARTLERAREAYALANECGTCPRCRGRAYPRGGRCIARCTEKSAPAHAEPPRGLATPVERALPTRSRRPSSEQNIQNAAPSGARHSLGPDDRRELDGSRSSEPAESEGAGTSQPAGTELDEPCDCIDCAIFGEPTH